MWRLLLYLSFIYTASIVAALADDPSTYFGGTNNDEYLEWLSTVSYDKSTFLPCTKVEGTGAALHWTITGGGDTIQLAVVTKSVGWAAFGLGESGSMLGADIVMYNAGTNTLIDSYVLDQTATPLPDECQSWTLVASKIGTVFTIFEATRLLDTLDTQDRPFLEDGDPSVPPTRVLAAWGTSMEPSYHGDSTARGSIRFFASTSSIDELQSFARAMEAEAEGNFTIQANEFVIPAVRTTYQKFCLSREDLMAQMNVNLNEDLHTIGFEPIIDNRTKKHVHHFVLAASMEPWNSTTLDCTTEFPILAETAYSWAPGDVPFLLPPNVGGPLGSTGFQSFQLEIHYDNPSMIPNMADNSGVRLYYTSQKREYDLGMFDTGDPLVSLDGTYISNTIGLAQHVFHCPESCSSRYVTSQQEPLTVIREQLHMHKTGVSMVNIQIRNGQVLRQGQVEYWDFNQQGNFAVAQAPFEIQPGDSFRTICNYRTTAKNETWGLGSDNEMCMASLAYYPRQPFSACGIGIGTLIPGCEVAYNTTPNFDELGRVFGTKTSSCGTNAGPIATPTTIPILPTNSQATSRSAEKMGHLIGMMMLPSLLIGSIGIVVW